MVQRKINRGRHIDHLAGRHSISTNQCPPPPSPHIFYRPDALPAAQPTASKHWRQLAVLTCISKSTAVNVCDIGAWYVGMPPSESASPRPLTWPVKLTAGPDARRDMPPCDCQSNDDRLQTYSWTLLLLHPSCWNDQINVLVKWTYIYY